MSFLSSFLLTACSYFSLLLALAVPAYADDLLQIYRDAQSNDPIFAAAQANYFASIEKSPQARAGLLPQINSQWSRVRNTTSPQSNIGTSPITPFQTNWNISLTQPLFRWDRWQSYQQGKLSEISAQLQLTQAQNELILRVTQAYFDLLVAQDSLALTQSKRHSLQAQLAQAKHNFEIGAATIVDTHDAQARHDLAYAQEIAAQSELELKQGALAQITNKPSSTVAGLRTNAIIPSLAPAHATEWVKQAEQNNTAIMLAQISLEVAQREKNKAGSGHFPSVDLIASRTYSDQIGPPTSASNTLNAPPAISGEGDTYSNQIGIQITVPLFSGGAVQSQVRETLALIHRARHDLENARRNAVQNTRAAFLGVTSGLAQIQALQAAQKSAQSAYASNQLGYEVGVRINIDVMNAQDQLIATQHDLYKAHYDTLLAYTKLKATVNTLEESDVIWLNTLLTNTH
ncbi:MAG: TolC family outer membrane protein [Ottowia sp.]|nr:TolC family outer membrane protein [Ottowia sp.]